MGKEKTNVRSASCYHTHQRLPPAVLLDFVHSQARLALTMTAAVWSDLHQQPGMGNTINKQGRNQVLVRPALFILVGKHADKHAHFMANCYSICLCRQVQFSVPSASKALYQVQMSYKCGLETKGAGYRVGQKHFRNTSVVKWQVTF